MIGKYADKVRKVYNNKSLANSTMLQLFAEFTLAKDLIHPNIIEYKYFMRKYDPDSMNFEFHIIMELMDGDNMEDYLDE